MPVLSICICMFYVLSPLLCSLHTASKQASKQKKGRSEKTYTPEWENVNSSVEFTICISLRCEYRHRHNLFAIITLSFVCFIPYTHAYTTLSLSHGVCVFTLSYTLHFIHNFKWIFSSLPRTFIQFYTFIALTLSRKAKRAQKKLDFKVNEMRMYRVAAATAAAAKKTCFLPQLSCRQLLSCEQHYGHIIFASPSSLMSMRGKEKEKKETSRGFVSLAISLSFLFIKLTHTHSESAQEEKCYVILNFLLTLERERETGVKSIFLLPSHRHCVCVDGKKPDFSY